MLEYSFKEHASPFHSFLTTLAWLGMLLWLTSIFYHIFLISLACLPLHGHWFLGSLAMLGQLGPYLDSKLFWLLATLWWPVSQAFMARLWWPVVTSIHAWPLARLWWPVSLAFMHGQAYWWPVSQAILVGHGIGDQCHKHSWPGIGDQCH